MNDWLFTYKAMQRTDAQQGRSDNASSARAFALAAMYWVIIMGGIGLIFYPVFAPVTGGGHSMSPMSQVKIMAIAHAMYTFDYDGRLPQTEQWMDDLEPYVHKSSVFIDYSIKDRQEDQYGFAFYEPVSGIDVEAVSNTSEVPLVFQSGLLRRNAAGLLWTLPNPPRNGKVNYVSFLDAHAKAVPSGWPRTPIFIRTDESGPQ